jgi:acetyltransferase-like isoleucine patch superfamily enzyme
MRNLLSILRESKKMFHDRDVALVKTIYWNWRCKQWSFPFLLYPDVHFRIGRNITIKHHSGRLKVGCRWDISRFKQSEMKICENGVLEVNGVFRIHTGCSIDICKGARLSIGSGGMNINCRLVALESITIGNNVLIGENVNIRDGDNHSFGNSSKPTTSPVIIGHNVWIGLKSTILKGVTIGEGAVVAANSLVNKDVAPHTFVGGVPAKLIKENIQWK